MVRPLAGHAWRVRVSVVRLDGRDYRIVRPARVPPRTALYEGRMGAQFEVGKDGARMFARAWALAARSPHTVVHLPLRAGAPESCWGRPLDLVLLHHRLGFPPSRWKSVRQRLGAGAAHTVRLPDRAWPAVESPAQPSWPDFRDHLRWEVAADTLVVTGSRAGFDGSAWQARELVEKCPSHQAEMPGTHCCAEIVLGRPYRPDRRHPPIPLHVELTSGAQV